MAQKHLKSFSFYHEGKFLVVLMQYMLIYKVHNYVYQLQLMKDFIFHIRGLKKFVQFADGVRPGEGTSSSDAEESFLDNSPLNKDLCRKKFTEFPKDIKKRKKFKVKTKVIYNFFFLTDS